MPSAKFAQLISSVAMFSQQPLTSPDQLALGLAWGMVSTPELNGGKQRIVKVPRIAVTFAWLGLIACGVGLNVARYPIVSQMVRNS